MPEASSGTKLSREKRGELTQLKAEISRLKETMKTTRDNLKTAMDRRNGLLKEAGRERSGKKEKKSA